MDEKQAIARIRRGDLTGLEGLVQTYQVKAVYTAYLILQDRQLAEDVAQAAFLRVAERIKQYDENLPFGPWFLRSVVNAALDTARRGNRWVSLDTGLESNAGDPVEWLTSSQPCPEDLVETRELRQSVRLALKKLTPEQRSAIVLRYFLEMDEAEMTSTLHRPPSTIKWWLHEAKRRLKDLLSPILRQEETYDD